MAAKCVAISESSDVRTCWKGTVLAKSPLPAGKNLFLSYMGSLELIGEWKVTVESWYHTPVKPQLHIATPHLSWKSNDAEESSLGIPYASEINLNVKTDGCRTNTLHEVGWNPWRRCDNKRHQIDFGWVVPKWSTLTACGGYFSHNYILGRLFGVRPCHAEAQSNRWSKGVDQGLWSHRGLWAEGVVFIRWKVAHSVSKECWFIIYG